MTYVINNSKPTNIMGFVNQFLPRVPNNPLIAKHRDLDSIINGCVTDGSYAAELLEKEYDNNVNHPRIKIDFMKLEIVLYERAIQGFIEQVNSPRDSFDGVCFAV